MNFPVPDYHFHRTPEPPPMVRIVSRSDVTWNRPVFKAPPLVVAPPALDPEAVAEELRRGLRQQR